MSMDEDTASITSSWPMGGIVIAHTYVRRRGGGINLPNASSEDTHTVKGLGCELRGAQIWGREGTWSWE